MAAIRGLLEKELRPGRLLHQPQQSLDSLGDAPLKGHCLARWRILINLNVLSLSARDSPFDTDEQSVSKVDAKINPNPSPVSL